jgi:general secretion pathway protein B
MSFILDALKKSESDRQRQSGPSLFEVKVAPPRRTLPIWAVAIAVLLGINVIVVSWMLLRHPTEPAAARAPAPAAAAPSASAAATASGAAPPSRPAALSAETAAGKPSIGVAAAAVAVPATAARASPGDQSTAPQPSVVTPSDYAPAVEPAAQSSAASGGAADDLPLYQQIVASDGLPALHLDLHVFAQHPQDRFVMINMHRLQEGDTLPSGVQVEAIRPDGVVLSYHGTRFLLPRN